MARLIVVAITLAVGGLPVYLEAQGRVSQQGRAIVEFRSPDVNAVAAYEYSQRNHAGQWILIEFAVQAAKRIAIHRNELSLHGPVEGRVVPLATQEQFLEDSQELNKLLQNAVVTRRPLASYFTIPPKPTIVFFSAPGRIVHDSAVTNIDEVATGDLFFKAPDGRWPAGGYRLVLNHEQAKAELPIELK
jgi:hypothetical protein